MDDKPTISAKCGNCLYLDNLWVDTEGNWRCLNCKSIVVYKREGGKQGGKQ